MIEWLYRQCIIPGFESGLKRRKTMRYLQELEHSQWWTRQQLEELQFQRLRSMLEHCYQHSRYFNRLWDAGGLHPSHLQSLSDFTRWPITSRETMRDCAKEIRTSLPGTGCVRKRTGGSSGMPLEFLIDLAANERRIASSLRGYAWAGASPGTRQTHLWGMTLGAQSRMRSWKEHIYNRYLYRRDFINSFDVHEKETTSLVARINRYDPKIIVAYTTPLYCLARDIDQLGLKVAPPAAIIVGAEKLHDYQRKLIERVFAAPVFETYGSREFSLIGAECGRHQGLHLTMENLLIEVVDQDGTPTPAGQEGNIVVTDLFNVAMPFMRYAIGDRAIAGLEACPCGRGLPLLRKISGRQLDVLITADGHRLAGEYFPHILKDYSAVRQFQVTQRQRDLIEMKFVVDRPWGDESRETLRRAIQKSIGKSTTLLMSEVPSIPLTPAGKLRVVVGHEAHENSVIIR
ncbi:MAG: hypothetical protein R3C09_07810 [Pirellulaceae bacterium]|jgi:phenylacetate-CoA ligase